jgi:hypothetical protein
MSKHTTQTPHTPGPWNVHELAVNEYAPAIYAQDGTKLCQLDKWEPPYRDEQLANASLIAAAPAMLEALKAIKSNIDALPTDTDSITAFANVLGKLRSIVIQAIAQAEGK